MDIETSLLGPEVDKIIAKATNNNTGEVTNEIIIHTAEYDLNIDNVLSIDILEDYNVNYAEEIGMEILCPMGDLIKTLYPERNNLEVSIIKNINGHKELERFKLILLNIKEELGSGRYKNKTIDTLNKEEMYKLKGQCVVRNVEAIRLKNVEGIYRDHTVSEVLIGLFHTKLQEISINGQPLVPYINMLPADNVRTYKHIIIPSATKLVDLATLIQETDYGIYNGHIGVYLKNMKLGTYFAKGDAEKALNVFMYPLYRTDNVESATNKLIIYSVPNVKYSMIENTYLVDGNDLRIISSDDGKKINTGDDEFMDKGVGYVGLDANTVMKRPVDVKEKLVNNTKASNNIEEYMKDRGDGSQYRQLNDPTDNQYHLRSNYLKENGDIVQVKWNFSNTKYLIPGMAVIYTYLGDNNNVVRLNGVLQSHYTVENQASKMRSTILNVFIEKDKSENA